MMSSFTEFAYKSAEKSFKKTPSNKKTMMAAASKGRWLLIISAFVAASADDSLRGPALRRDVALAPQGLDLTPKDDLALDGQGDGPGWERPTSTARGDEPQDRRLNGQGEDQGWGWTVFRGRYLNRPKEFRLRDASLTVEACKSLCVNLEWCESVDVWTEHHWEGAIGCFLYKHEPRAYLRISWFSGRSGPAYDHYYLDRAQYTEERTSWDNLGEDLAGCQADVQARDETISILEDAKEDLAGCRAVVRDLEADSCGCCVDSIAQPYRVLRICDLHLLSSSLDLFIAFLEQRHEQEMHEQEQNQGH